MKERASIRRWYEVSSVPVLKERDVCRRRATLAVERRRSTGLQGRKVNTKYHFCSLVMSLLMRLTVIKYSRAAMSLGTRREY